MKKTLSELELLKKGVIKKIRLEGNIKRRFIDLGIIEGTTIIPILDSPFKNPRAYLVRGTVLAIRKEDAMMIDII